MKKILSITIFLVALLLFSSLSFAQRGGGQHYPVGVDQAKAQQFCKEVQPLYQKDIQLRGEILTLWAQNNPDWNLIKQKEQERAALRVDIHKKAHEMGLPYGIGGKRGLNIRRLCGW